MKQQWIDDANCAGADADTFYSNSTLDQQAALRLCRGCPVAQQCLNYALQMELPGRRYGIWGGTTATQRARMAILNQDGP